jgi:hypothetical protein
MNRVAIILCAELLFICIHCIFVLNKNELPPLGTGSFRFVVCGLISIYWLFLNWSVVSLLVVSTIMADNPAPKRARRAIGTVCEACGKHFATSDDFDQHRTSGYLVGTPCHILDDGSTRAQLVATSRQTMSTAMLQKLKFARRTNGTASKILSRISTYPKT